MEDWVSVRRIIAAWSAVSPETNTEGWPFVARIIKSAKASQSVDRKDLMELLRKSKRLLSPLDDPFSNDFGLHRWLRGSREEVYSDWLAWIMQGLDNAADVFRLFDLPVPPDADQWKNTAIKREFPIPGGRLDIVVRWPGKALLVVEVKITDEEFAYTSKQGRYARWMHRQKEPHKEAVLLTVDADTGMSKGDFKRSDWRKVCVRLRCIAAGRSGARRGNRAAHRSVVRSALTLAFAGAVEQNLLGMHGSPVELMEKGHLLNVFPVQEHLKEFHESAKQ
jgi:hypothetical protein